MRRSTRRSIYWVFHYILIACFLTIALFPLFWVFKVSVTPNDLLYTEGVRLWPSRFNFEHYASVISHTNFPLYFRNSLTIATVTAIFTTLIAAGAGYSFSRFVYRGKFWLVGLMLWAIGHFAAVWAAKRDPMFVDVVRRHLRIPGHLNV